MLERHSDTTFIKHIVTVDNMWFYELLSLLRSLLASYKLANKLRSFGATQSKVKKKHAKVDQKCQSIIFTFCFASRLEKTFLDFTPWYYAFVQSHHRANTLSPRYGSNRFLSFTKLKSPLRDARYHFLWNSVQVFSTVSISFVKEHIEKAINKFGWLTNILSNIVRLLAW